MKERLKELRTYEKLTQQGFSDKLGIQRSTYSKYELGTNEPTDAVINLICDRFHVNETWLRTGKGKMHVELSRDDELQQLIDESMGDVSGEFKRRLAAAVMRLTPEQIRICKDWIRENFLLDDQEAGQSDQNPGHADQDPEERELKNEEKVEDYRRQLEAEAASAKSQASLPGKEA